MKLVKVSDLFDVVYGSNLELNALELDPDGVNFVSRTAQNNGVSAKVKMVSGEEPIEAGMLTVAGGRVRGGNIPSVRAVLQWPRSILSAPQGADVGRAEAVLLHVHPSKQVPVQLRATSQQDAARVADPGHY